MRLRSAILWGVGLALLHYAMLRLSLAGQGIPALFWVCILLRGASLVAAAPPLGVIALADSRFETVLPLVPLLILYWIGLVYLCSKIVAVVKVMKEPARIGRRSLFACSGILMVGAYGAKHSVRDLQVRRENFSVADLPKQFEGLRVALLADLHRGPAVSQAFLEEVVDRVNDLKPDVILMPGDFISKSPHYFGDLQKALSRLTPRLGSFASLGNHDHWEGKEKTLHMLEQSGIHPLNNRRLYLSTSGEVSSQPGPGLCLAGVDDYWKGEPDLETALKGQDHSIPTVLLSHNPDIAEDFSHVDGRVDLQVSGHTHGGQIVFPGLGPVATASGYGTRYVYGWGQGPKWPVFTTMGVGTSTVPVRVGTRPEIVVFTLSGKGQV